MTGRDDRFIPGSDVGATSHLSQEPYVHDHHIQAQIEACRDFVMFELLRQPREMSSNNTSPDHDQSCSSEDLAESILDAFREYTAYLLNSDTHGPTCTDPTPPDREIPRSSETYTYCMSDLLYKPRHSSDQGKGSDVSINNNDVMTQPRTEQQCRDSDHSKMQKTDKWANNGSKNKGIKRRQVTTPHDETEKNTKRRKPTRPQGESASNKRRHDGSNSKINRYRKFDVNIKRRNGGSDVFFNRRHGKSGTYVDGRQGVSEMNRKSRHSQSKMNVKRKLRVDTYGKRRYHVESDIHVERNRGESERYSENIHGDSDTYSESRHGEYETYSESRYGHSDTDSESRHGEYEMYSERRHGDSDTDRESRHGEYKTYNESRHGHSDTHSESRHGDNETYSESRRGDSDTYSERRYDECTTQVKRRKVESDMYLGKPGIYENHSVSDQMTYEGRFRRGIWKSTNDKSVRKANIRRKISNVKAQKGLRKCKITKKCFKCNSKKHLLKNCPQLPKRRFQFYNRAPQNVYPGTSY